MSNWSGNKKNIRTQLKKTPLKTNLVYRIPPLIHHFKQGFSTHIDFNNGHGIRSSLIDRIQILDLTGRWCLESQIWIYLWYIYLHFTAYFYGKCKGNKCKQTIHWVSWYMQLILLTVTSELLKAGPFRCLDFPPKLSVRSWLVQEPTYKMSRLDQYPNDICFATVGHLAGHPLTIRNLASGIPWPPWPLHC